MNKFKTLLKEKEISKQLYDLIKNDRDCFYAFVSTWLDSWDQMDYYRSEISKDTSKRDEDNNEKTGKLWFIHII
ncbi:MAG: hypothetical protein PHG27_02485 [Massilibacteroides sp.]|nr:hypothetical protein [Massilibacteroides sp.]MDD4114453.1 hypothetical protein [Massilibacteroides sp.]